MSDPRDGCPDCGDIDHHGCRQPDTAPEDDLPTARWLEQWCVENRGWKPQDHLWQEWDDGLDAIRAWRALNGAPATPAERAVIDAESDADLIARLLWRASGWLDDDFEEKGSLYRTGMRRELTEAERVLVAEVRRLRSERNQT